MHDIFIPSYHRAGNIKTAEYFIGDGYDPRKIHVVIDSEADDRAEYEEISHRKGFVLHIFDMSEARERYDYVHRPSTARRSAGQARNMFYDIAMQLQITSYVVIDDDTQNYQLRPFCHYIRMAKIEEVVYVFERILEFMEKHHIGMYGLSQTGEMLHKIYTKLTRNKVMNTTFINAKYIYRGERGLQDDDTSQFACAMNEGYYTASLASGIVLQQAASATQKGGLTDLYHECKLLNKALTVPIQFPSCCHAERQKMNGNRLHHRINYRYLYPRIMKSDNANNIAWDAYPEDVPFTSEPKRKR